MLALPIAGCAGRWEPASTEVVRVLTVIVRVGSKCSEGPTRVMRSAFCTAVQTRREHRTRQTTQGQGARRGLNHTANREQYHTRNRSLRDRDVEGAETPNVQAQKRQFVIFVFVRFCVSWSGNPPARRSRLTVR